MFGSDGGIGNVTVVTTNHRGHTPEEWVELLLPKIIFVADSAPPAIRDQAHAFRDQLRPLLVQHMRYAIDSDRTTIANKLREAGHPDLADAIRRL